MRSTIRLFRAVPIMTKGTAKKEQPMNVLLRTMAKGYLFAPEVVASYNDLDRLANMVENEVGLDPIELNASFHKSWAKVTNASMRQLVLEQLVHYMTTYGYASIGIYSDATVFIPREKLLIPAIDLDGFTFTIIKGYTSEELKEKLLKLLESGIALKEETARDVMEVATYVGIDEKDMDRVKNKEVRIMMFDYLGLVPRNPTEFLRYCVYKATESTLLIKNMGTFTKIQERDNYDVAGKFAMYDKVVGFEKLAEIFYRYKPLFLAFRTNDQMRRYTNQIRKLAKTHHKPMRKDYLNEVTAMIKSGTIKNTPLQEALSRANIFRKIRLAYTLNFRLKNPVSTIYRIRNGKSYVTEMKESTPREKMWYREVLNTVKNAIASDLAHLKGKRIYIPEHMNYALPATEKQFVGNLPSGTSISVPDNMVFGIHWENQGRNVIDIDLSLQNQNVGKIGWDSSYRTQKRDILFSGDLVTAPLPNGATELFYVKDSAEGFYLLNANYYNYDATIPVPIKIIVASDEGGKRFGGNSNRTLYMVDPNKVYGTVNFEIKDKQHMLGLLGITPEGAKFYFIDASAGGGITSRVNKRTEQSRAYMFNYYTNTIELRDILGRAGAHLVFLPVEAEIDLSPEALEKDTIIGLLTNSE